MSESRPNPLAICARRLADEAFEGSAHMALICKSGLGGHIAQRPFRLDNSAARELHPKTCHVVANGPPAKSMKHAAEMRWMNPHGSRQVAHRRFFVDAAFDAVVDFGHPSRLFRRKGRRTGGSCA